MPFLRTDIFSYFFGHANRFNSNVALFAALRTFSVKCTTAPLEAVKEAGIVVSTWAQMLLAFGFIENLVALVFLISFVYLF